MKETGTILIVGDEPRNRKLFKDVMQYRGFTVLEARNGREVVAQAKRYHPDLTLMDIQRTLMDGITVTRILSGRPPWSSRNGPC